VARVFRRGDFLPTWQTPNPGSARVPPAVLTALLQGKSAVGTPALPAKPQPLWLGGSL
jgi:hypothetical protein